MKRLNNLSILIVGSLVILDLVVWQRILFFDQKSDELVFLDVGQGDATLGYFRGQVKFLIDAGPDSKIIYSLQKFLPPGDRYIDLAVITHPQLDHFGGFNFLLDRYDIGAFIMNGKNSDLPEWQELLEKIADKEIPILALGSGDEVRYAGTQFVLVSPDTLQHQSAEVNDGSIVAKLSTEDFSALLTGDISQSIENYLIEKYGKDFFKADVLKVPHHGSKYSSSHDFLAAVNTKVALIGVGKNSYGHPTNETLMRLKESGAEVMRTDIFGSLRLIFSQGKLKIFSL